MGKEAQRRLGELQLQPNTKSESIRDFVVRWAAICHEEKFSNDDAWTLFHRAVKNHASELRLAMEDVSKEEGEVPWRARRVDKFLSICHHGEILAPEAIKKAMKAHTCEAQVPAQNCVGGARGWTWDQNF